MSYKKQELLTLHQLLGSPPGFCRVRVAHLFSFLWVFVLLLFVHSFMCTMLSVSLHWPFLISSSVFSNDYLCSEKGITNARSNCLQTSYIFLFGLTLPRIKITIFHNEEDANLYTCESVSLLNIQIKVYMKHIGTLCCLH